MEDTNVKIKPSFDIATNIADFLEMSLDIVGNTDTVLEDDLLKKITSIQKLPHDKKNVVMDLPLYVAFLLILGTHINLQN